MVTVEERRTDRDLRAPHRLADDREQRSPEHGERDANEDDVVVEKRRLATHHALELRACLEVLEPRRDEECRHRDREDEERREPRPNRRLGERMHALDHATARNERAKDREQERRHD